MIVLIPPKPTPSWAAVSEPIKTEAVAAKVQGHLHLMV